MTDYDELLAELKAKYRDAVERVGEEQARRAFLKATAKPPVQLSPRGHGVQHWDPPEAA